VSPSDLALLPPTVPKEKDTNWMSGCYSVFCPITCESTHKFVFLLLIIGLIPWKMGE
jgi:hypothetical protein